MFMFCGYYEVCIKHLIDKFLLFLLIASHLHLLIQILFFVYSPLMFLLSQIISFSVVSLLPEIAIIIFVFFFLKKKKTVLSRIFLVLFITQLKILCSFAALFLVEVQFSSVAQSCPTLCDPMNCSMSGPPVHHQLPEFTQTHVHWVSEAIQPSHPLVPFSCPQSFPASGSFQMSQLFASGGQSIGVSPSK